MSTSSFWTPLTAAIASAQERFAALLRQHLGDGAITRDQYVCYLRYQVHLTRGVQRYFIRAASHETLLPYRRLRRFLFDFGLEEESHYLLAQRDLEAMGEHPGAPPLDVALWHAYFTPIALERPFVRIGAACVLENLSSGAARPAVDRALSAPFLRPKNTKFVVLHHHEQVPHGDQILEALFRERLRAPERDDLVEGARTATVLYLRMATWALDPHDLSHHVEAQERPTDPPTREVDPDGSDNATRVPTPGPVSI